VTIGVNSEINGFLPASAHWDNSGLTYANAVFDSLTHVAANGTAKPYLAQSVTPNADKTVWTITLRPGVTFHDGSPLNADVVVANFNALTQSALTNQALKPITGVRATGQLEVAVSANEPLVAFPHYLATQVGYIVALAQLGSNDSTHPVGTGPFSFVSWAPNDHFSLQRTPNYWRPGLPYLDSITFKPIAQDQSREASLRSGTIDVMLTRDPIVIRDLGHDPSYQQVDDLHPKVGQTDMDFIILNTSVDPTNDLTVRQALARSLNTTELNRLFGAGIAQPNTSMFPPASPFRPADNGYPTYDLAKARQLVAQAAPNHGGTISLSLGTITDPRLLEVVQAIANMWGQAGMQVSVGETEQVTFIDNLIFGKYQADTAELFGASDPDLNYVWLSSTTANGPIALNFARNKDDVLEAALQQGRTQSDPATRIAAYQTVDKRLSMDLPYLWLGEATWSLTASDTVMNFNNLTFPDGSLTQGFAGGIFTPTPIWRRA
jgi:ABC-type transport system substrate-binding protein